MKVLYDHTVFSQQDFGGISRYFATLMSQADSAYNWRLPMVFSRNQYLREDSGCVKILPKQIVSSPHTSLLHKVLKKIFKKGQNMANRPPNEQAVLSALREGEFDLFHPTYYADYFWQALGDRVMVITVHDMIHELYPEFFPLNDSVRRLKLKMIHKADHTLLLYLKRLSKIS